MPQQYRRYPSSTLQSTLRTSKKSKPWWIIPLVIVGVILLVVPVILITKNKDEPTTATAQAAEPTFDKTQFSLDDPASPWVVVNKQRALSPKTYVPASLRAPAIKLKGNKTDEAMQLQDKAATALESLDAAAKNDGVKLALVSAYRSYNSQKTIYDSEVKGFGQAVADQESARPGHSEHQSGWAADVGRADGKCEVEPCFADTPEGQWLAANAYKYGFILRYAKDKTDITGYIYEPWHLRYVGPTLSEEMHRTDSETLEEFFGLSPAPDY